MVEEIGGYIMYFYKNEVRIISEVDVLVVGGGTVSEKEFVIDSDKIAVKTTESGTYVVVDKSATEEGKDEKDVA